MFAPLELGRAVPRRRPPSVLAVRSAGGRRELRPASILVVEDDPIMAMAIRDELTAGGYDVVAYTDNGPESVALAERHKPDLVVMDIRLRGEMDGVEAARAIKQRVATRLVFVTAHADPGTRRAMDAVGYHALLPKPYTGDQLARAVRAALER